MPSSSHLSSIFSDLEHCCLYIFTKCLKRANMCYISENSTWNVLPFNWSSYSTGPPIQMILPFNWSPNSGQFVDDASRGPLDAIFLSSPKYQNIERNTTKVSGQQFNLFVLKMRRYKCVENSLVTESICFCPQSQQQSPNLWSTRNF